MVEQKTFDPYDMFKKFSAQWEQQANDLIKGSSNNQEFMDYSRLVSDTRASYLKVFKKNQEFYANQFNIPTKADVANVGKLAIQTDEKLDSLEEQIWKLQDSVDSSSNEMESITEVSRDIIKLVKQLKKEQMIVKNKFDEVKALKSNLQEVKNELAEIHSLKEEILILKELIGKSIDTKAEQEQEHENQHEHENHEHENHEHENHEHENHEHENHEHENHEHENHEHENQEHEHA